MHKWTIDDKLICISNDDAKNYLLCRFKLAVEKFGHVMNQPKNSKKIPKVVESTNKETLFQNVGD